MANHRHKRDTDARFKPRAAHIAGPLAVLATASVVSLGVLGADLPDPAPADSAAPAPSSTTATTAGTAARRLPTLNRSANRVQAPTRIELMMSAAAVRKALRGADTKRWTTEALNLWSQPGESARKTGVLDAGEKVVLTGRTMLGREEIRWGKNGVRWVTRGYTTDQKPFTLGGDCTNGTSVPSGVSANIAAVHEAVCAEFPEITVYGTLRGGGGDHGSGLAVDIMVSGERGWQVAEFVRKYYAELGVNYVIYSQSIWSLDRSGEGWRGMEDRGSATANHFDHVHVSTY